MATQIDIRDALVAEKQGIINASPTLIIGLGGSGKEVLMQLRRLFFTNIREVGLPIIQYLWIDTDPSEQDIYGTNDAISSKVYFNGIDIIDVQVNPMNIDHYFKYPTKYSHIFEWMHESVYSQGPNMLQDGAGQVRPCGRLAFFHHYSKIKESIEQKLTQITDEDNIDLARKHFKNKIDDKKLNVFLIASVAGGTGAGMLIDTAFLIKEINKINFPNYSMQTTGILFLPSLFDLTPNSKTYKETIYSNGYATLMELDHFMSPFVGMQASKGTFPEFVFKWDGNEHLITAPPFHDVYLIDKENSSGKRFTEIREAFRMASEFIFVEFRESNFGGKKRSIRSNLAAFFNKETRFVETDHEGNEVFFQYFPNRYSSFGISSINLDIDRMKNAAAYFLGKSLVEFWESTTKCEGLISPEIDKALKTGKGDKIWDKDTIKDFLLQKPHPGNSDVSIGNLLKIQKNSIEEKFKIITTEIEDRFKQSNNGGWEHVYGKLEQIFQVVEKGVKNIWSENQTNLQNNFARNINDAKTISDNADICYKKMKESFTCKFHELLSLPGWKSGKKGVKWANDFLEESVKKLELIETDPNLVPRSSPDETICPFNKPTLSALTTDGDAQLENMIKEAESIKIGAFRNFALKHHKDEQAAKFKNYCNGKKEELNNTIKEIKKKLMEWFDIEYHNDVCKKVKPIMDKIKNDLSSQSSSGEGFRADKKIIGLKNDIKFYREELNQIINERKGLFEAFIIKNKDVRHHNIFQNTIDEESHQKKEEKNQREMEIERIGVWYQEEIRNKLAEGASQDWETILDTITENFFQYLFGVIPNDQKPINTNDFSKWGFRYLFDTLIEGSADDNFIRICKSLDEFCFRQVEKFFSDTNADKEFQKSNENKEFILKTRTEMADVWIHTTLWEREGLGEIRKAVGVPIPDSTPTGRAAQSKTELFSATEIFSHEEGQILFYRELGAFPLFRLGNLNSYKNFYIGMQSQPAEIYKRHIDYNLKEKIREILPPENFDKAINFFNTGVAIFEALLFGCLESRDDELWFCPRRGGATPLKHFNFGNSLNRSIQKLNSDKNSEKYEETMTKQVEKKKETLIKQNRFVCSETLRLLEHYTESVYPILARSGGGEQADEKNFLRLIVDSLWRKYQKECCSMYLQKNGDKYPDGYKDEKLQEDITDAVEKINLNEISIIFPFKESENGEIVTRCEKCGSSITPFKESEARAELRVLKI